MLLKSAIKRLIETTGYTVHRLRSEPTRAPEPPAPPPPPPEPGFYQDGLRSIHNHDFIRDPAFCAAYERGVQAAGDLQWRWRVHIGLWAAYSASKLPGDFVECGVNRGFLSSAIMHYLDWDSTGKTFYLLDTFSGLDARYVSEEERLSGAVERSKQCLDAGIYVRGVAAVRANFAQWKGARIIEGPIPDTLPMIDAERVAYLHLDLNNAPPEVATFNFLWDRLVPGAFILLDDYAYKGYEPQKRAMDAAAGSKGLRIASLPTGQGLLLKP